MLRGPESRPKASLLKKDEFLARWIEEYTALRKVLGIFERKIDLIF
jgi:hypothetical protein